MAYKKVPIGHSEFGGGPGLIDPMLREDRVLGEPPLPMSQELWEIYATDSTKADSEPETSDLTYGTLGSGQ